MIEDIHIYRYEVPLTSFRSKREGLILAIRGYDQAVTYGEIAPLETLSRESLRCALKEITSLIPHLIHRPVQQCLQWLVASDHLYASVSAGLFGALYAHARGDMPLAFTVSALLNGRFEEILNDLPYLEQQNFTHVKLKLSALTLKQALHIVDQLKNKYILRVDLNRSWPLSDVLTFFSSFSRGTFEYVEEPFAKKEGLLPLNHPVALDETVREKDVESIKNYFHLKAIVLKPMLQGIGPKTEKLIRLSKEHDLILSLSSSFETGIGLYQIALLAEYLDCKQPLGVDTYRFIPQDILIERHVMMNGIMTFAKPTLDMRYVTEVL